MANLTITNSFSAGTKINSANMNANFSDISTYINNRDSGTAAWQYCNVTATVANPMTISGNQATTELAIDNTATDGDPILSFKLSTVTKFVMGVDDGDSDKFKIGTTAIGTSTSISISGADVTFSGVVLLSAGTVDAPSLTKTGDTNTGPYYPADDQWAVATGAGQRILLTNAGVGVMNGVLNLIAGSAASPSIHLAGTTNLGISFPSTTQITLSTAGTERLNVSNGSVEVANAPILPAADNSQNCGSATKRWSDVRSALINGSDYGFANGYILREFPATYEDVQTKDEKWMEENANQGLQVINDIGEIVMVIGRTGILYVKETRSLTELLDLNRLDVAERARKLARRPGD